MGNLKLGILDQSIVPHHKTATEALADTVATARLAERLGYSRFWVSEHHNSSFIAGSAPELLMVKLAEATEHIRIGSGGVMLPNHSAYKVAENFRLLEALFPGRIDLGMGRAPGGDRVSASLLNPSNDFSEERYLTQLEHLQHFFHDTAATQHGRVLAVPVTAGVPEQWILSSSGGSGAIAARFGMGLAVAKFINGFVTPDVVENYRKQFRPSPELQTPHALLSVAVLCGETEEKAAEMRKFLDFVYLRFEKGNFDNFGDPEYIRNYHFSDYERERIRYNSGRVISGTPDRVKEELQNLAASFGVDEIVVTVMSMDSAARFRSFELLAETFGLQPGASV